MPESLNGRDRRERTVVTVNWWPWRWCSELKNKFAALPDSAEEMNRLRAPLIRLHIERRPLRTSSIFLKRRYAAVGPPDEDDRPRPVAAARKEAVRDDARDER